jgi:Sjoegren syndrome nuclear autoantigen 1
MTQQGASLQNYNNELVSCIEELREKREELNKSIAADEEEKGEACALFARSPPLDKI